MHEHRTVAPPAGVARPGSTEFEHQRRLLLELAVDPPPLGDGVAELADTLDVGPAQIEAAAAGLERAGLLERRGGRLFASPTTRAIELLWPFAL
jgi:DNA-binding MarR family transcriptional regulator